MLQKLGHWIWCSRCGLCMGRGLFLINFTVILLRWIDSFPLWYFSYFLEAKPNHISLRYLFGLKDKDSYFFLAVPCDLRVLSSPTCDRTWIRVPREFPGQLYFYSRRDCIWIWELSDGQRRKQTNCWQMEIVEILSMEIFRKINKQKESSLQLRPGIADRLQVKLTSDQFWSVGSSCL